MNVNLRPYYAEGSKTVGYEIAEQLGWRLPDNVVVPMAGGSLIPKIRKAFGELIELGLVEDKPVRFFGAQATGCSPISTAVKAGHSRYRAAAAEYHCALAGDRQSGGRTLCDPRIHESGGWAEDVSDVEIVSIQELAETEGVFTETAGGVTVGVARKLYKEGRIGPDETTVLCITGNGLKTTDVLAGEYVVEQAIAPKIPQFEKYMERELEAIPA